MKPKRLPVAEVIKLPGLVTLVESRPHVDEIAGLFSACGVDSDSKQANEMRGVVHNLSRSVSFAIDAERKAARGADHLHATIGLLCKAQDELASLRDVEPVGNAIEKAIRWAKVSETHFELPARRGRKRRARLLEIRDQAALEFATVYRRYAVDPNHEASLVEFLQTALESLGLEAPLLRDDDDKLTRFGRRVLRTPIDSTKA